MRSPRHAARLVGNEVRNLGQWETAYSRNVHVGGIDGLKTATCGITPYQIIKSGFCCIHKMAVPSSGHFYLMALGIAVLVRMTWIYAIIKYIVTNMEY